MSRLTVGEFKDYLKSQFPDITNWYNGSIDKAKRQCIAVYPRGNAQPNMAVGGPANSSYGILPISILVHWGENSDTCEKQANAIYEHLYGLANTVVEGRRIISTKMLDNGPVNMERDTNNICEMVIRAQIFYEKEVALNE